MKERSAGIRSHTEHRRSEKSVETAPVAFQVRDNLEKP